MFILIEDSKLRVQIGDKARKYACQHHSIDEIGNQFVELIEKLCNESNSQSSLSLK